MNIKPCSFDWEQMQMALSYVKRHSDRLPEKYCGSEMLITITEHAWYGRKAS
jgi:hypothetical protein